MEAIVIHAYGSPDVLQVEDIPVPTPGEGEVLVRVRAAGVGPWDALIREGKSVLPQPLPLTPGSDICGAIESTGPDAGDFWAGEDVYGATNPRFTGGYAQYALASARMIAHKPESLNDVEAASAPVVAVTAWQMLFDYAAVTSGQRLLIQGAGGNVGSYAVQLAKYAHAYVIATATGGDCAYVASLGADEVVDYRKTPFESVAKDVDAVIDTVGGETLQRSLTVVRPGGVIISSAEQPSNEEAARRGIIGVFFLADVTTERLDKIASLFDNGKLKPRVGEVLPLGEARTAHEMLNGAAHLPGKIVLLPA